MKRSGIQEHLRSGANPRPALPWSRLLLAALVGVMTLASAGVLSTSRSLAPRLRREPLALPADPFVGPTAPDRPAPAARPAPAGDALAEAFAAALSAGDRAYDQRRFRAASRCYGRALELDPTAVPAWVGRGNARARSGDLIGARADLSRALTLTRDDDPRRPLIQRDRDALLEELGPAVPELAR